MDNLEGARVPTIPTAVIAGLCSAIVVAALSVVALDQAPSRGDAPVVMMSAAVELAVAEAITFTDATGNHYRKRRD
ncbi:hypothetical protein [Methylobacterium thuringiense]|uniref:Uncharacterized protein n=1 Tax=Methylobacterium thuringiense TaxID=1003091 RepID=A0ABQ4TKN8_9HYPH|nr:hypothetical protein [Methylobacterium thuringiense]GJE55127.1 hypothetical protein EKPJFOCH_1615 [Methylobacterium thuringiense]